MELDTNIKQLTIIQSRDFGTAKMPIIELVWVYHSVRLSRKDWLTLFSFYFIEKKKEENSMTGETWILVANSTCARIFKVEKPKVLTEIETPMHCESRLKGIDLASDRPGRAYDSAGQGRHAMEQATPPKEKEEISFARQLASHLGTAYDHGKVSRLYLAASPAFLGYLRQFISPNVTKLIIEEINKDLTHMKIDDIQSHFPFAH